MLRVREMPGARRAGRAAGGPRAAQRQAAPRALPRPARAAAGRAASAGGGARRAGDAGLRHLRAGRATTRCGSSPSPTRMRAGWPAGRERRWPPRSRAMPRGWRRSAGSTPTTGSISSTSGAGGRAVRSAAAPPAGAAAAGRRRAARGQEDPRWRALMAALAAVRERRSRFTEERAIPELDLPLPSEGTLRWTGARPAGEAHDLADRGAPDRRARPRLTYERPDRGIRRDFALAEQPEMASAGGGDPRHARRRPARAAPALRGGLRVRSATAPGAWC